MADIQGPEIKDVLDVNKLPLIHGALHLNRPINSGDMADILESKIYVISNPTKSA